jgi:hypothetical protein
MPHGHQLVATIWLACYDTTVAISIVWMHVTRTLLLIPSAPSRKVYRIRKTPSRQLAPRMVCRILPCWYQGEIRVLPPFRGDRDQVFFLGIRRSEISDISSVSSGKKSRRIGKICTPSGKTQGAARRRKAALFHRGPSSGSDRSILDHAATHDFILVSTDSDFERLLRQVPGAQPNSQDHLICSRKA